MNIERLEKIATHLETGKLGHKKFDFRAFSNGATNGKCGTNGCAIGEFPIIFKDDWKYIKEGVWWGIQNYIYFNMVNETYSQVGIYLSLTVLEVQFLFNPGANMDMEMTPSSLCNHLFLSEASTRYEVATRIRRFIDYQLHHTLEAREAQEKKDRDFRINQRAIRMRMIRAHEMELVA